jgi:putative inorganic carbon (HCO3(-)) transporter
MNASLLVVPTSLTLRSLPWVFLTVAACVFLALNVDFAGNLQWHDGQRLYQLVLLAIIVCSLLLPGMARGLAGSWMLLPPWIRAAFLGVFALGFVSSLLAPLPHWALLEWGLLWLLLIMALCVAEQRRRFGEVLDRLLVLLLFATATAYAVSVCVVYVAMLLIGPEYGQIFDVRELYVSFSNVRFFGHIQTMVLPFLLLPAMWWGTTWCRRLVLWSVPALWWMLAVGSGTRGTWIALLVGVIAVAIYGGLAGRRWIRWQLGGLIGGCLCYALFIWMIPQLLERPVWFLHRTADMVSLSLREVLWATALDFSIQHPWFGVGPMHYAYFADKVAAHPHNAVLQWLAEWGIPAALLLTVAHAGDKVAMVPVALLAALGGASAQAMVDGVLVMPISQTLLVLLCGSAMGMYFTRDSVRHSNVQCVLLVFMTVFAAAVVVRGVIPDIGRIAEREKAYLATQPPDTPLFPRFWTLGWIRQ